MTSPEPETAAAKPRLTQKQVKRAGQSARAMVVSVLATLGIALLVVLLNPGSTEQTYDRDVDVRAAADISGVVEGQGGTAIGGGEEAGRRAVH